MTAYHNGTAGQVYYAKPLPIVASPWDGDDVALTETGATGWFSFENDPTKAYAIYHRIGGSPASSDEVVAQVESGVVQSGDAFTRLGEPAGASIAADIAAIEGGGGGDYSAQLAAIQAKTDLITSQNAPQTRTPANTIRIVRNDSLVQQVPVNTDYTGYSGTFTIRHRVTNAVLLQVTTVAVTSSTILTITLATADTAFALLTQDSEFGFHPYDIQLVSGATRKTEQGTAIVVKDQTT